MPYRVPTVFSCGDIFSVEAPSSQMTIACVDTKLASTPNMASLCCPYPHGYGDTHGTWLACWEPHTLLNLQLASLPPEDINCHSAWCQHADQLVLTAAVSL